MAVYRNNGPRPVWSPQKEFRFPTSHHLVITTAAEISLLSKKGVRPLLNSPSDGILAVREAKDGSGNIAFADGRIVIVHSIQRVSGKTFKLHAEKGQIRLLEFSSDYQRLFFTTSLHHSILCFSLSDERVISTTFPHPSPPTVLFLSKDSGVLVTASERPVVIYVHNLRCLTAPPMLHPQASSSPVTSGAFHPDRNDVFLLCFLDGTIASYNLPRNYRGDCSENKQNYFTGLHGCERNYFKRLHRIANVNVESGSIGRPAKEASVSKDNFSSNEIGSAAYAVAGAAFVPGYRSRAVSVGADGKCRLIDFENKGKLLRTWYIGASATCLSILGLGEMKPALAPSDWYSNGHEVENKNYLIAIGRTDGIVMLYDSVGLLLQEWVVSEARAKVTSVDWSLNCTVASIFDVNANLPEHTIIDVPSPKDIVHDNLSKESFTFDDPPNINAPPAGRNTSKISMGSEGNTYETIITKSKDILAQDRAGLMPSEMLVDLFSSAEKTILQKQPYRIRPRLSSSTFLTNSQILGNGLSEQSKKYTIKKGFHRNLFFRRHRLALDGQNSDSKAKLKTYQMLPRELLQNQHPTPRKCEDGCTYPIPGSHFSSDSSSDDDLDPDMDKKFEIDSGRNGHISGLNMPMSRTSTLETSSSDINLSDFQCFDSRRSKKSLFKSILDESLDKQYHLQNQNTEVIKDAFPITNASAYDEGAPKRLQNLFAEIHQNDDWGVGTRVVPRVSSAPLPRLTTENLLLKQAAVLGTSSGYLSHQSGSSSVIDTLLRSDEDTRCTRLEQLLKAENYNDIKFRAPKKRDFEDNTVDMQYMNYPDHHCCCINLKELRQLQPRIETLIEKVVDIHRLMQCHTEDVSNTTD